VAEEILRLERVCKAYNIGMPSETEVLHDIDLHLERGEFLALIGPSGSGKSTLLNIVGLLDRPTSGRLLIKGAATSTLDDAQITSLRGHTIGFVFQYHHLISAFTALENVEMPMLADRGFQSPQMEDRARELMGQVGLESVMNHMAANMSGGQQQRVAVARALAGNPSVLLADEPTGNLDSKNSEAVMELLRDLHAGGATLCMVTHDPRYANWASRQVHLFDGRVVDDGVEKAAGLALS
jgi:lipoprotein-releasing system ATP-binding protein